MKTAVLGLSILIFITLYKLYLAILFFFKHSVPFLPSWLILLALVFLTFQGIRKILQNKFGCQLPKGTTGRSLVWVGAVMTVVAPALTISLLKLGLIPFSKENVFGLMIISVPIIFIGIVLTFIGVIKILFSAKKLQLKCD